MENVLYTNQSYCCCCFIFPDAEWFDVNNRDELPTKVANSMIHISGAIGRQMADLFANLWSSAGCLAVAFVLNAPLALIMLLIVPVVVIFIAIISCFIRKASKQSGHSFSLAGALATEVLAGIKTVASLCAEPWAITTYGDHVVEAQKNSVWAGFLTALSTGITSLLFYITYTFAFFIGKWEFCNYFTCVFYFMKCFHRLTSSLCLFSSDFRHQTSERKFVNGTIFRLPHRSLDC